MTFNQLHDLIMEMPVVTGDHVPQFYDKSDQNQNFTKIVMTSAEQVGHFMGYALYAYKNNRPSYYLVDDDQIILAIQLEYSKSFDSYYIDDMCKSAKHQKNMMLDFLFQVLLKEFPSIQSSHRHTTQAQGFWLRVVEKGLGDDHTCSFVALDENGELDELIIEDAAMFAAYKDIVWSGEENRIRIYA